jgi:hypothetical protein
MAACLIHRFRSRRNLRQLLRIGVNYAKPIGAAENREAAMAF